MDKPILFYEVRPQTNRATGDTIYVPAIVERDESIPLDEIIIRAIDRGLIAGLKPSAAKQVADAIALQMYEEFRQGMDRVLKLIVRRFVTEALKDDAAAQTDRESVERFYHSLLSGVFVNWLDADMNYDLPDFVKKMLSRVCEGEWGKLPQELAEQPADPAK